MKPRLYIVDDEAPARARLKTLLTDVAAECPHELIGEAADAQQALEDIAAGKPDIVLLDVQMPGMTGIELAAQLTQLAVPPRVIFVTAYDDYALKAFEVQALDYLLKPVRATRLVEAIRRVVKIGGLQVSATARRNFTVQERGRVLLVPVADVLYLKAEMKYVTLRTRTREYLIEESLTSIEEELASVFVRVHRNALVARDAIVGIERGAQAAEDGDHEKAQESWQVILRDLDERLPISRRQLASVKALVR